MNFLEKICTLLSKDKIQRLFYMVLLLIWLYIYKPNLSLFNSISSFGIKYIWIWTIPAILLIIQILFNNFLTWLLIFGLIFIYSIIAVSGIILKIIHRSGNSAKSNVWDAKQVFILISIFLVLFFINWLIYKLKPKK